MSCVFCGIVEDGAELVLSDGPVAAFLDHRPVFPGHVLVVPTEHVVTLADLPTETMVPLLSAVQRVMAAVGRATGADGTFVAANNVVSQSVPHLHVHVVPRRRGDGLRGFFWPRHPYRNENELVEMRERIRTELQAG